MLDYPHLIRTIRSVPDIDWDSFSQQCQSYNQYLKGMRTQYWYQRLQQRLTAPASAYAMELLYEPEKFRRDSEGRVLWYPGKWKGYETEAQEPKANTLEIVERLSPGSTRELKHPLWEVLRMDDPKLLKSDAFLHKLDPATQAVIFKTKHINGALYTYRAPVQSRLVLIKLEQMPSLDSLACLTWLLREASQKECETAVAIGRSIHVILLMLAAELQKLKIGARLLTFYVAHVLPLATPRYHRMHYTAAKYLRQSCELNLLAATSFGSSREKCLSWPQLGKRMREFLKGRYGLDVCLALAPFYALDYGVGKIPQRVIDRYERQLAIRGEHSFSLGIDNRLPLEGSGFQ